MAPSEPKQLQQHQTRMEEEGDPQALYQFLHQADGRSPCSYRPFPVTHRAAGRWLHHMQLALDGTPGMDPDSKTKMMNFFRHTAYFLVAGDELKPRDQGVVACKHAAGKTEGA